MVLTNQRPENLFSKQFTRTPKILTNQRREYLFTKQINQPIKKKIVKIEKIFAYFARIAFNLAASASLSLPDFSAINISLVFPSQSLISGCSRFLARAWKTNRKFSWESFQHSFFRMIWQWKFNFSDVLQNFYCYPSFWNLSQVETCKYYLV